MTEYYESKTERHKSIQDEIPDQVREMSKKVLHNTMRDTDKMAKRFEYLKEHPEDKIHIRTKNLKEIVDFNSFWCHPDCSVGRNQAVRGSDIDGGIVVTNQPTTPEERQLFVNELRLQGFSCFTPEEKADLAAIEESGNYAEAGFKNKYDIIEASSKARLETINFMSVKEVHDTINQGLTAMMNKLKVLAAGREIR